MTLTATAPVQPKATRRNPKWFDFDGRQYAWRIALDGSAIELVRREVRSTRARAVVVATYATPAAVLTLSGTHPDWRVALDELAELLRHNERSV